MNKRKITEYTTEVVLSFYDNGDQECDVHSQGKVGLLTDDFINKAVENLRVEMLHVAAKHTKGGNNEN